MTETLNDRLDRMELEIKNLSESVSNIKPADISRKEVTKLIGLSMAEMTKNNTSTSITIDEVTKLIGLSMAEKPTKDRDISQEIKDEINKRITRGFVNKLYRGAK